MPRLRMNQAISAAIADEMRSDPSVVLFGEDVAAAGGVFKTSEGLQAEFGPTRVRDTPISEMGFLGAGVGAAATGLRPVVEIMFVEFLGVALDQLSTEAAKFRYLSGGQLSVPLTIRASMGAGLGFGAQHSQTLETWFMATPGLKLVVASGARTAYGLVRAAIRDQDPVVVLEPRSLYGKREEVETGLEGIIELGCAQVVQPGTDVTIVTSGQMVDVALTATGMLDSSAEVIDLQTLVPWDRGMVLDSVAKTGRLVVLEENPAAGGWGTEIVAYVAAGAWSDLDAPPMRITTPDVPVPFAAALEQRFLPNADYIASQIGTLVSTGDLPEPWWHAEEILR